MSATIAPLAQAACPVGPGDWLLRPRVSPGATRDARERERARQVRLEEARRRKLRPVAVRLVQAMRALRPLRAGLTLAEGEVLSELKDLNRFEDLGYVRFSDFSAEALHLNPRTARRRMALHRALGACEPLRGAYLAGKIGVSQVLALEPVVTRENASLWIRLAERLPHARLVELVRRARSREGPGQTDTSDDGDAAVGVDTEASSHTDTDPETESDLRQRIHILSPRSAGFAIEHGLETAQSILGWDAPRDECLDAILSEATPSLNLPASTEGIPPPAGSPSTDTKKQQGSSPADEEGSARGAAHPDMRVFYHRDQLKRARRVLNRGERTLQRLQRLAAGIADPVASRQTLSAGTPDPVSPRQTLSAGALLSRYQALTRARNPLRALEARLVYFFFALGVGALLECRDDVADSARLLGVSERTVRNLIAAGAAFEQSHAMADAFIQGRIGLTQVLLLYRREAWPVEDWVRRAKQVTLRQLRRELRLRYRLQWIPSVRVEGLPNAALEDCLKKELFRRGWTPKTLEVELESRGLTYPSDASTDPAENPVVLARLETLVDLLILDVCRAEHPDSLAHPLPRKTLSVPGRHVAVVIWARPEIWDRWGQVLAGVQEACTSLPPWAVATLLVKAAMDEWQRQDPARIPTEVVILERDDYRCRAPGCTSRKHLEVHHIIYRSHSGPDDPENLITLCHQHHHHAVHRGTMRITGKAPYALVWEFPAGAKRYQGERLSRE